jgi:beta-lactamase regulating signal transducer with metallopeptidase domain
MNPLLELIGSWLRDVVALSWKGAWLAVLAGVLLMGLRRHLSPAWRHGLWALVLLRLAVPDVGTSPIAVSRWLPMPEPAQMALVSVSSGTIADSLRVVIKEDVAESVAESPAPASAEIPVAEPSKVGPTVIWSTWNWLSLLWLVGMGGMIVAMLALHLRLLWRVRRDHLLPAPVLEAIYVSTCAEVGVAAGPRLILTDAVNSPALFGILRPAILLPRALADSGDPAALRLILRHELAHWQRRDLWTQLGASFILVVHWFNPAVWWAVRRLRSEAEMAADARALRHAEVGAAHRLGEVLLGFTRHATAGWLPWLVAVTVLGISENRRDLQHRIEALVDLARGRRTWWLLGLLLLATLTATGFTQAPAEPDQPKIEVANVARVTGIVVDTEGQPIAGAECTLSWGEPIQSKKTTSDILGRFQFEGLQEGTSVRLWAAHPNYLNHSAILFQVSADLIEEQRIVLSPSTAWLTGRVMRNGEPIVGARILVGHGPTSDRALNHLDIAMASRIPKRAAFTDDQGHYRVANWTNSDAGIMVLIDAPGMKLESTVAIWKGGANLELEHQVAPGSEIGGTVVDAAGRPVPNAMIDLASKHYLLRDSNETGSEMLNSSNLSSHWIGTQTTDANGEFHGKALDDTPAEQLFLIAYHPQSGWRQVRLADWEAGSVVELAPWSKMRGTLLDGDEKPIGSASLQFSQILSLRDGDTPTLLLTYNVTAQTDEQGRYQLERLIPGARGGLMKTDAGVIGSFPGPYHADETLDVTLRLPQPKAAPNPLARVVRGRIRVPEGFEMRSTRYQIRANFTRTGNVGAYSVDDLGEVGRFDTRPLDPGDYTLRVWVQPKEAQWRSPFNSGLTLQFRIDGEAGAKPLDLGELKLEASDFEFSPSRDQTGSSSPSERKIQKIDLRVSDGGPFATWASSPGSGVSKESAISADGRLTGAVVLSSAGHFLLRATAADGSRLYSALQSGVGDLKQALRHDVAFHAGVAVEGQLRDLPANNSGGWVAASVTIKAAAPQGEVIKGGLPYLTWNAWAPVSADGRFRFDSLPRGGLTLVGFGEGWVTRHTNGAGCEIHANLIEAGDSLSLVADTTKTRSQGLRVLQADGSAATGAVVTVASTSSSFLNRAWQRAGYAVDPGAAAAFSIYQNEDIPGHRAIADSEGQATLRNQHYQAYGSTTARVTWTDPNSGVKRMRQVPLQLNSNEVQIVRLDTAAE